MLSTRMAYAKRCFSTVNKDSLDLVSGTISKFNTAKKAKMFFKNVAYDEEGRYLLLHHMGARKYLVMNFLGLAAFTGITLVNYVNNPQVFFGKEWLGKTYLFGIIGGIVGLWLFSNR